ncbi:MAG: cupin domain-containing protein [Planctomycetaceae bacterium]|nr:cupin domain-containing protein [Planctomycetaceae bacterium]
MEKKKAFMIEINSEKNYQRLVPGVPETFGLKSGRVYLEPGADCGRHNTENKEEQLVFLFGSGTAEIADEKLQVGAGKVCYIPPRTEHNIINTGQDPLIYIFTTAPADGHSVHKEHDHHHHGGHHHA